jgi:hypothetical protein
VLAAPRRANAMAGPMAALRVFEDADIIERLQIDNSIKGWALTELENLKKIAGLGVITVETRLNDEERFILEVDSTGVWKLARKRRKLVTASVMDELLMDLQQCFICPVCQQLLRQPMRAVDCIHRFCQQCIVGEGGCPSCDKWSLLVPDHTFNWFIETFRSGSQDLFRQRISIEIRCPICLDTANQSTLDPECGHYFCKKCIEKSLRILQNQCPVCRNHLPSKRSLRQDPQFDEIIAIVTKILLFYRIRDLLMMMRIKAFLVKRFRKKSVEVIDLCSN